MIDQGINALTIDVEDGVNQAMRNFFHTDIEPTIRVKENTLRLLDLFSEYNITATFFILGEVAKKYPQLVKEISHRNHELGIHGYSHTNYHHLSKEKVKEEIFSTTHLVEDISGVKVLGHRAPEFSVNRENLWVLEILLDAGIKYDSSIFPTSYGRYGWKGFKKEICWFELNSGRKIVEAPLSVVRFLGQDLPACGGSYLRVFPFWFTNLAFRNVMQVRPVNLYMHPQEIDLPPFQNFYMDRINSSSLIKQLKIRKYWIKRNTVIPKLVRLLETYRFTSLNNVINETLN